MQSQIESYHSCVRLKAQQAQQSDGGAQSGKQKEVCGFQTGRGYYFKASAMASATVHVLRPMSLKVVNACLFVFFSTQVMSILQGLLQEDLTATETALVDNAWRGAEVQTGSSVD